MPTEHNANTPRRTRTRRPAAPVSPPQELIDPPEDSPVNSVIARIAARSAERQLREREEARLERVRQARQSIRDMQDYLDGQQAEAGPTPPAPTVTPTYPVQLEPEEVQEVEPVQPPSNPPEQPNANNAWSILTPLVYQPLTTERLGEAARVASNVPPEQMNLGEAKEPTHRDCYHCGCTFKVDQFKDAYPVIAKCAPMMVGSFRNPHWLCPSCWDRNFFTCDCCNTVQYKGDYVSVIHVQGVSRRHRRVNVCVKCALAHYSRCHGCGNHYRNEELTNLDEEGRLACSVCLRDVFRRCSRCNAWEHRNRLYQRPSDSDSLLCRDCTALLCSVPGTIHGHAFKPRLDFIGRGPYYYGVELEVECPRTVDTMDYAAKIERLFEGFVFIKRDGSLEYGFEIVSCPATLEEHRLRWGKLLLNPPEGLRSYRTQTCGLHVHCSRTPLSALTVGKMLAFMGHAQNRRFIETIAQRPHGRFSKFVPKDVTHARYNDPDRYQALNVQNTDTVEFRLFKGTLRQQSFFKSLEFCDALIHFSLPGARSYRDAHRLSEFLPWVSAHRKEWPNLEAFIQARWNHKQTRHTNLLEIPVNCPRVGEQ
jgi:hypothetical protein